MSGFFLPFPGRGPHRISPPAPDLTERLESALMWGYVAEKGTTMQKKLYRVEMAGHTLKVYSAKTYIVAIGRETKVTLENGQVLVPFALKLTETDRFVAAQRRVRDEAKHLAPGCELAIIELATGERVWH